METINTIPELVKALEAISGYETWGSILKKANLTPEVLSPYCSWNEVHHTRNLLHKCPDFELLLACSEPGQKTSIHNYGHEQGWALIIAGEMTEVRYLGSVHSGSLVEISRSILLPGSITYINDYQGMHQFINSSNGRTLTLHLFVEPFTTFQRYNTTEDCFETATLGYDTDFNGKLQ
jgi:hypothetical protein